jgi:hypothetical protein
LSTSSPSPQVTPRALARRLLNRELTASTKSEVSPTVTPKVTYRNLTSNSNPTSPNSSSTRQLSNTTSTTIISPNSTPSSPLNSRRSIDDTVNSNLSSRATTSYLNNSTTNKDLSTGSEEADVTMTNSTALQQAQMQILQLQLQQQQLQQLLQLQQQQLLVNSANSSASLLSSLSLPSVLQQQQQQLLLNNPMLYSNFNQSTTTRLSNPSSLSPSSSLSQLTLEKNTLSRKVSTSSSNQLNANTSSSTQVSSSLSSISSDPLDDPNGSGAFKSMVCCGKLDSNGSCFPPLCLLVFLLVLFRLSFFLSSNDRQACDVKILELFREGSRNLHR